MGKSGYLKGILSLTSVDGDWKSHISRWAVEYNADDRDIMCSDV